MNIIEEWHADIEITIELVKTCLQNQSPEVLPITTIKQIGEGWDNKVFLINENTVFRFPRRKAAVALMQRENQVLIKLPRFQNIAIPVPKYIGTPSSEYPYPFQGYVMIKGVSAYQAQLNASDRIASIKPLAQFLKQLHGIDEVQAIALGAKAETFDNTTVAETIATLVERVTQIIARKLCNINQVGFQQEITAAQKLSLNFNDRCLVHNDLDYRHLIFNEKKLVGVIDWGDMGITHKAIDLSIVWGFYPNSCHNDFLAAYGKINSASWDYARFIGLYSAFTHILYGSDIGDKLLVSESLNAIKTINPHIVLSPA